MKADTMGGLTFSVMVYYGKKVGIVFGFQDCVACTTSRTIA